MKEVFKEKYSQCTLSEMIDEIRNVIGQKTFGDFYCIVTEDTTSYDISFKQ